MSDLDMDLASAILRIEQAHREPEMRDALLDRLATCDAVRLRQYVSPGMLARMAEVEQLAYGAERVAEDAP